jgi:ABC-type antimicrobial peptide transport system permease subunit
MFETSDQVIVDRRFQQNCGEEVVGKVFSMSNTPYTVKGLCETYTYSLYDSDGAGFVFVPRKEKDYIGHCYLKCTPGDAGKVRKYVDDILGRELPATIDYRSTTLMEDIYAVQVIEYSLRKVFVFFAIVCILITLLGVYSSVSMDTAKRVKEVAIMKVNGAQGRHIAWKFTRLYAILLITSAMVAFPLLYIIFHFWRMMYVQFFNCGPVFWISLFLVLAILVGITIFWKVSTIVKINPAKVIQQE